MSKCVNAKTLYEDIEFCQGKSSLPGIRPNVFGISLRDVVSVPRPKREGAENLKDIAVIKDNIVVAQDKGWHKIGLVPDDGNVKSDSQGSYGSKTFAVTATVNIPGTEEEATAYAAEVNNDQMIFLVQQRNGKFRLIGSDAFPAQVAPAQDTGSGPTDANQTTLAITATDEVPAPFYQGEIVLVDGTKISGLDGSAITE